MARPRTAFKLAAVACSVILAAGFISYRAGAFDWVQGTQPAQSENRPETPAAEPAGTTSPESGAFISGSKSGIFIVPPGSASAPLDIAEDAVRLL